MREGLILAESSGAGSYFPQAMVEGVWLEEVIGKGAVLLSRGGTRRDMAGGRLKRRRVFSPPGRR